MSEINRKTVVNNFTWRLMERIGAQGVTFIVSIILARILDPSVYGIVAVLTVFTSIMQTFVDSGLGGALIQKKDVDDIDFSSVFYVNIIACVVLYIVMYFTAPFIASFYNDNQLCALMRVLSITILISGVKNVQQAYVSRNLLFKRFFFSTLGGTIFAAICGICMAYEGYGPWALVLQNVFNQGIDALILWITVEWRPQKTFSFDRVKKLFSFGWKLSFASIINAVYVDIRQLIVGKKYTTTDLGYYNCAVQYPKTFITTVNVAFVSILFPVMAREQDNLNEIKSMVKKSILVNAYIVFPIMMGLGVCANQLVRLILTDKWLPCVPYFHIFCIEYALVMFNTSNQNSFQATGRSDIYLRNDIFSKFIGVLGLYATMWISVYAMAISSLVTAILSSYLYAYSNKKLIGYGFFDQIKDMIPNAVLTVIMGVIVYAVALIGFNDFTTLIIQIFMGILIYIIGSKIMKLEAYKYMLSLIQSYLPMSKE